jgi:hypothetical protein
MENTTSARFIKELKKLKEQLTAAYKKEENKKDLLAKQNKELFERIKFMNKLIKNTILTNDISNDSIRSNKNWEIGIANIPEIAPATFGAFWQTSEEVANFIVTFYTKTNSDKMVLIKGLSPVSEKAFFIVLRYKLKS